MSQYSDPNMKQQSTYFDLNAMLNLYDRNGKLQLDKDKEAAKQYFLEHVNQNTVFFHSLKEKLDYLVEEGYYDPGLLDIYSFDFIKGLFQHAYGYRFRFRTFMGAYKFYTSYAMRTMDNERYLERYEDRICITALFLADGNEDEAYRLVDEMISGRYTPATPTILNAGKLKSGMLISCYLLRVEDNMESIGRSINSSLQLSKRGGGVALCLTNLREKGAPIKGIEGRSAGPVKVMKIYEDSFSYADQLGQRQGAGAIYISCHHPDITDVLDTKRENADEKIRIKTLSIGVVITDIMMQLASKNIDMYLFSPYDVERVYGVAMTDISITDHYDEMVLDKRIKKTKISPRKLLTQIAEVQQESGYPYIMFEDTVNYANPIAGRVSMSNLCVTGETLVFTDHGNIPIIELVDKQTNIWNGFEWSSVLPVKTGKNQRIVKVVFSDGNAVECTNYHKWPIVGTKDTKHDLVFKPTNELKSGDCLLRWDSPVLHGNKEWPRARIHGFATGDGTVLSNGKMRIYLYGDKVGLWDRLEEETIWRTGSNNDRLESEIVLDYPKFFVPGPEFTIKARLEWLAGWLDADGHVQRTARHEMLLGASTNIDFLKEVKSLLFTLGVHSKISLLHLPMERMLPLNDGSGKSGMFNCKATYRIIISSHYTQHLLRLGLDLRRIYIINGLMEISNKLRFVRVDSVIDEGRSADTYCFTEHKRNLAIFNNVISSQCSEILQVSSESKFNEDLSYREMGQDICCNLGSLNIAKVMDKGDIGQTVETAIRALTVVSRSSDISCVPSIQNGNQEMHAVGLGQMNLHGFLAREGIVYGSPESLDFVNVYFSLINYHSLRTSCLIAQEMGETFYGFEDSDYSNGKYFSEYFTNILEPVTQKVKDLFDYYGISIPGMNEWRDLAKDIQAFGLYNAYRQAVAPTGSISYINDSTASIHPITNKIEVRKEGRLGRIYYPAPYLNDQNIHLYQDAFELGPKAVIDVYAQATKHVDQGLSCTLFFPDTATTRDFNKAQIYAFKKGIKTLYYVRLRQKALSGTDVSNCVSCEV